LIRTCDQEIDKQCVVIEKGNSAMLGRCVQHAAFVYNRFTSKESGRTPHEERKPRAYSGNRVATSGGWRYVFESFLAAMNFELQARMDQAEAYATPIELPQLGAELVAASRLLAPTLSQTLTGSTLQLAMNVPVFDGLEAVRWIVKQKEPSTGDAQVGGFTAICGHPLLGRHVEFC